MTPVAPIPVTQVKTRAVFTRGLPSPSIPMMRQFLNVVHQAIQRPLPVHLLLATQAEAAELCISAQVAQDRLHRGKTARNHASARVRVDPRLHPVGETRMPWAFALKEGDLSGLCLLQGTQTFVPPRTGEASLFRSATRDRRKPIEGAVRTVATEPLSRGAGAGCAILRQLEVLRCKSRHPARRLGFVPARSRLGGVDGLIGVPQG